MKKKMTKLASGFAVISICLLGSGCGQPPDFTKEVKVRCKSSRMSGSLYTLEHNQGTRGSGWGTVCFKAPNDFAEVGDVLICTNGVIAKK